MSANEKIVIAHVDVSERKQNIVRDVLADLPEWFGLPESTKSYVTEAAKLPLWAAYYHGHAIGFIDYFQTSIASGEINCMGIKKQFHHQGIGTRLERALESYAKNHAHYLQVKTVDEGHYPEYDQTIRFYESVGFERLEVFPKLWDSWNPCLVLVKKL
ncbi:GNAT family N-acetyltransferase [Lacticaseibacillus zeae]|uniref:GNAT family N-acetyltransferase n=1 Tax=Lacticaseibacillus zeae TaxID=57037 RepID=A0A5R8LKK3_LACZE|nr:GNAT family N-acetyltransferase [Lacticaseibacillus zeae]TLF37747.1 GNAT family N-acetyltransferase [Lacticaseibacillus zeae]